VPAGRPETVYVVPEPVVVMFPGPLVRVHVPVPGRPVRVMLPEEVLHVGWVMDDITGDEGVTGWLFIVTFADDGEMHPWEFVTLKEYVPGGTPETAAVEPDPEVVTPPGERVTVQDPEEGRSRRLTVPPGVVQSG